MKWNFVEYKTFDNGNKHVSSEFVHRGIGDIEVFYTVDYEDLKSKSEIYLFCGDREKRKLQCRREEALKEAKKMYLNFVKNKITSDDVVIKVGNSLQIVDIYTGLSITLSKQGVDKLETLARKLL